MGNNLWYTIFSSSFSGDLRDCSELDDIKAPPTPPHRTSCAGLVAAPTLMKIGEYSEFLHGKLIPPVYVCSS